MLTRVKRDGSAANLIGLATFSVLIAWLFAAPIEARALDSAQVQQLLRVRAGATCLSAESLAPLVEQWLYDETLQADVVIEVEGSASDPHSASFRVVRAGQTIAHRAFQPGPPRCEHLRAALALAIAFAFKASLLDQLGRPLLDDPTARAEGWWLSMAGLASYRLLPSFAPGLDVHAELALGRSFALRLGALGVTALGVDFERTTGGFDSVLVAARADVCVHGALTNTLYARVCAGLLGGAVYAWGYGQPNPRSSLLGWSAFTNAAGLSLSLAERWSLGLEFAVSFPLRPLRIGTRDSSGAEIESRSLAAVGFMLSLGPSYHF
jgi:hypothetical protein